MFNLKQWQSDFADFVQNDMDKVSELHVVDGPRSGKRRLNIYANNIRHSLTDALKAVYKVTHQLVGEEYFNCIAKQFIPLYPSRSGNLHDFGREFPDYLQQLTNLNDVYYLPYVARLEWAYHIAFHAQEASGLDIQQLQVIPASQIDFILFQLNPSVSLIHSPCKILPIWISNQQAQPEQLLVLEETDEYLLVMRRDMEIEFHTLTKTEYAFLYAIECRLPFHMACEKAVESEPDADLPLLLARHIQNGAITDLQTTYRPENQPTTSHTTIQES